MNCLPLSDVIVNGTLNLAILSFTSAHQQDSTVISTNGITSRHGVKTIDHGEQVGMPFGRK